MRLKFTKDSFTRNFFGSSFTKIEKKNRLPVVRLLSSLKKVRLLGVRLQTKNGSSFTKSSFT